MKNKESHNSLFWFDCSVRKKQFINIGKQKADQLSLAFQILQKKCFDEVTLGKWEAFFRLVVLKGLMQFENVLIKKFANSLYSFLPTFLVLPYTSILNSVD
jgi:hypothetical protein